VTLLVVENLEVRDQLEVLAQAASQFQSGTEQFTTMLDHLPAPAARPTEG
jgi:hypothetical protein